MVFEGSLHFSSILIPLSPAYTVYVSRQLFPLRGHVGTGAFWPKTCPVRITSWDKCISHKETTSTNQSQRFRRWFRFLWNFVSKNEAIAYLRQQRLETKIPSKRLGEPINDQKNVTRWNVKKIYTSVWASGLLCWFFILSRTGMLPKLRSFCPPPRRISPQEPGPAQGFLLLQVSSSWQMLLACGPPESLK